MSEKFRTAFFAYPAIPNDLAAPIVAAAEAIGKSDGKLALQIWPQAEIFGSFIPDKIRDSIAAVDIFICDITHPNMNVYYEAGYAIGQGKSIAPVLNESFANSKAQIQEDGLFDNIGYEAYENSEQLTQVLTNLPISNLVELYGRPINFHQPLFVLDTFRKTDFRNAVVSAVKDSKVFFRSFDPVEIPRFSTVSIIADTTASAGVVIPILGAHIDDAARHNLRASFLAGLSHGLQRQTLLLQADDGSQANPADYRDLVLKFRNEEDIREVVLKFAKIAMLASQSIREPSKASRKSDLQLLTLGASAAENEFRTLETYFVETAEYVRTLRGEARIIAGRKGSGKTAIFFRIRDVLRDRKDTFVTDLKPESHQLSLFREELLKVVDAGTFDHTFAAFWYFVILSEVLLTIMAKKDYESKFDGDAVVAVTEIAAVLRQFEIFDTGDFTSRINRLGSFILQEIKRLDLNREKLSPERLTNIIFRDAIGPIRTLIEKYTRNRAELVFLFDNIDKGWPANGVHPFDVRLVRLLVEALDKVRRDFNVLHRDFTSMIFLRNDIYELLVEETPDRGKAAQILIDWTDRIKLRHVIHERLQASVGGKRQGFEDLWARYFATKVNNRESFDYFVDHCLMRPRFLINIIENAIANAINRGHIKVDQEDCIDAVRQHANYLVSDFGYEIRDVSGLNADILYSFVGVTKVLTKGEIFDCFKEFGLPDRDWDNALQLLLWYGVLGIGARDGSERFIYDYEYQMKRLEAEIRLLREDVLYVVNPAFHVALGG